MTRSIIRSYTELSKLKTLNERYEYLKLNGVVGEQTFGSMRYLNQDFYIHSEEWKDVRNFVIARDLGCEMGLEGFPIKGRIIVHHMNPITVDDLEHNIDLVLDPEYLICVSHDVHNAITYGNKNLLPKPIIERKPNDTCPWKV